MDGPRHTESPGSQASDSWLDPARDPFAAFFVSTSSASTSADPRCGRPNITKPGRCERFKLAGGPACKAHMTDREQVEFACAEQKRQERAARELAELRRAQAAGLQPIATPKILNLAGPPACHRWSPPREDETWWEWHGNHCAVCGTDGQRLVTDHCHRSGLIRGLLCVSCNTQEGVSPAPAFQGYRRRPPAVIFGATVPYSAPLVDEAQPQDWVVNQLGPRPHRTGRSRRLPRPGS